MNLIDAMRSNITCRHYKQDPVPDEVLLRLFDAARYAPNGGNRQPVRFIAVRDAANKKVLRDLYLPYWQDYMKGVDVGAIKVKAVRNMMEAANNFAENFHEVPVIVVVCARLEDVHPTDNELGRLSIVGGASVYPAVQNMLLAARSEGLGTALTTLLCHEEPKVKELLGIPEDISTAAHVTLGYAAKAFPKKLSRRPLSQSAFVERYGEVIPGADSA